MAAAVRALLLAAVAAAAGPLHADSGTLAVSAAVLSNNSCRFAGGALALNFGNISGGSAGNASASASTSFTCKGADAVATFAVAAGNGLHSAAPGARRMRHATNPAEFVAYSLALSPSSGTVTRNVPQALVITGTVTPAQVGDAIAGAYSDAVVITVTP